MALQAIPACFASEVPEPWLCTQDATFGNLTEFFAVPDRPQNTDRSTQTWPRLAPQLLRWLWPFIPFADHDAACVPYRVFELPRFHRPDKSGKSDAAQKQGYRNKDRQYLHQRTRNALSDTVIDESDIAAAAASGVASPIQANGTATML
jgi:hypothetical protein